MPARRGGGYWFLEYVVNAVVFGTPRARGAALRTHGQRAGAVAAVEDLLGRRPTAGVRDPAPEAGDVIRVRTHVQHGSFAPEHA